MATSFLRKIILEELRKVLKEADYPDIPGSEPGQDMSYMPSGPSGMTKRSPLPGEKDFMGPAGGGVKPRVGDPKIKKLQKILQSVGYDVGTIDGIAGKKLFLAISQASKDMSGVGVPPERVAKDYRADPMAADSFLSMFSDPQQMATLRKSNVKRMVDKTTAPIEKALQGTGVESVPAKPVKPDISPSGRLNAPIDPTPMGTKTFGPRDPSLTKDTGKPKVEEPVKSPFDESLKRELRKLLKKI